MDSTFELVRDLERYLAALSKLYALDKKHLLQQLLVNAKIRAIEGYSHDNIDGGVDGHALQFMLPESLFLSVAKNKDELGKQICSDLNSVHNVRDEFFEAVWLEMDLVPETDWRHESGVAIAPTRIVPSAAASRIWEPHCFRLFLSHKATVKKQVGDLKITLRIFGISAFVAHEDVKPTKEWQDEIENALASMDAFAALMTETYHDSDWTDQEVGFALARGVPLIPIDLGLKPYGFMAKFQALPCEWPKAAIEIAKILIRESRMLSAWLQAASDCKSFDQGNLLSAVLPNIVALSEDDIDALAKAYNENGELRGAFGFNGNKPLAYGEGLLPVLNRLSSRRWIKDPAGKIVITTPSKRRGS